MAQLQFDSVDRIAHATIVTAPDRVDCLSRGLDLAAALVCQASGPAGRRGRASIRTSSA